MENFGAKNAAEGNTCGIVPCAKTLTADQDPSAKFKPAGRQEGSNLIRLGSDL